MKIADENEMKKLGFEIGRALEGGEVFELIGDLGAGKTTFAKGLANGLEIEDEIHSPTFNITLNYPARNGLEMNHYDFYRLDEPGIMADEIRESSSDLKNITLVEWGENIRDFLPRKITVKIDYLPEDGREVSFFGQENFPKIKKVIAEFKK